MDTWYSARNCCRELHAAEEEENAQDEATSIEMTRQIAALEDSSSYWA